jgi:hypothetical protein
MHFDLVTLLTFAEECNLWSSLLSSFLQPPVTSSTFGPAPFPQTPQSVCLPWCLAKQYHFLLISTADKFSAWQCPLQCSHVYSFGLLFVSAQWVSQSDITSHSGVWVSCSAAVDTWGRTASTTQLWYQHAEKYSGAFKTPSIQNIFLWNGEWKSWIRYRFFRT